MIMEMSIKITTAATVDEYIKRYPLKVQTILRRFQQTIKKAAPKADELISYQIPSYKYLGMLVSFAAWKNHIGFYPGAGGIKEFKKELSGYEGAKGSVQFPYAEPIPFSLITKIVKFRVKENEERFAAKKKLK